VRLLVAGTGRRVRLFVLVTRRWLRLFVTWPWRRVRFLMLMAWGQLRLVTTRRRLRLIMVTVVVGRAVALVVPAVGALSKASLLSINIGAASSISLTSSRGTVVHAVLGSNTDCRAGGSRGVLDGTEIQASRCRRRGDERRSA
jgi:hypothetical protein